jgi:hypothetical protein
VRFRDVRANARVRTARKLVCEMEALCFATDQDEHRRAFLFEGVSWRNQYRRVVHGELIREQIRADVYWKNWRSGARRAIRTARRGAAPPAAPSRGEDELDGATSPKAVGKTKRPGAEKAEPVVATEPTAADTACSEELARRIREAMDGREGVTEGEIFGGAAWMVNGNVACGTAGDRLLVRVAPIDRDRFVADAHVHALIRGARALGGFVTVDSGAIADDANLARWIDAATGYAAWLPPR